MTIADYRIPQSITEELDSIFGWLEIFVYSSKRSRAWESRSVDERKDHRTQIS